MCNCLLFVGSLGGVLGHANNRRSQERERGEEFFAWFYFRVLSSYNRGPLQILTRMGTHDSHVRRGTRRARRHVARAYCLKASLGFPDSNRLWLLPGAKTLPLLFVEYNRLVSRNFVRFFVCFFSFDCLTVTRGPRTKNNPSLCVYRNMHEIFTQNSMLGPLVSALI